MGRYASTNGRRFGAPGWNTIDAELVEKSSDLCICCGLNIESGRRHDDEVFVLGGERVGS